MLKNMFNQFILTFVLIKLESHVLMSELNSKIIFKIFFKTISHFLTVKYRTDLTEQVVICVDNSWKILYSKRK